MRTLGRLLRSLIGACRTLCFSLSHQVETFARTLLPGCYLDLFCCAPGENDLAPHLIGRSPPQPAANA